jgi:REP element-mobilizing transposase RayT
VFCIHIIIRGIERGKIFRHDHDKDNFIDRLAAILLEARTACYGWALMPNHAHFLFRSGTGGISKVMRGLLTGVRKIPILRSLCAIFTSFSGAQKPCTL